MANYFGNENFFEIIFNFQPSFKNRTKFLKPYLFFRFLYKLKKSQIFNLILNSFKIIMREKLIIENLLCLYNNCEKYQKSNVLLLVSNIYKPRELKNYGFEFSNTCITYPK